MSAPVSLNLENVPEPTQSGSWDESKGRQLADSIRTIRRNFQRIRDLLERAIISGDIVADKTLVGDVTGTIGASGATVVEKIRGSSVAAPTASEDLHLLRYATPSSFTWETIEELIDDILTTSGDLLYRSGSSITRLGLGSALSILAVNSGGTAPAYATLSALLDAAIGNTQGDVLYRSASGWAVLAAGTAGQVLNTNGSGANPSWETPSGGGVPGTDFDLLTDGVDSLVFAGGDVVWIVA